MDVQVLEAKQRDIRGSAACRRLREAGRVPAVLYGHKEAVVPLSLDGEAARSVAESDRQIVTMDVEGRQERALIKEIQWDALGRELLHMDFARVAMDEVVQVSVHVDFRGTPRGVVAGGVLECPTSSLDIECRAGSIPDTIRVAIEHLGIDDMVYARDVELPPGMKLVTDPQAVMAVLHAPRAEEEEEKPEEAEAAEPELIGREEKETEEETK